MANVTRGRANTVFILEFQQVDLLEFRTRFYCLISLTAMCRLHYSVVRYTTLFGQNSSFRKVSSVLNDWVVPILRCRGRFPNDAIRTEPITMFLKFLIVLL